MVDVGTLIMKIEADTKNFTKGFGTVKDTMAKVAKTAAIATAAVGAATVAVGGKLISMGADAEEMRNKYDVVFAGMTDKVDEWSSEYSKAVGRSKYDTQEYLSNLADLQQGLGMTAEESFDLSKNIVELGTDLASFNNVEDAVAIEAISKAMLGEAESAKQLGLLLNVDRVKDFAEAQGLVYNELTDSAKANLVYKLAVTQSQNAIGDAKRSAGSYTNQMKALKSSVGDIATTLGMKLIPMATSVVTKFNEFLTPAFEKVSKWWTENGSKIREIAKNVFDKIKEFAGNVVTFYQDELMPIFDRVKDWWNTNGDTVKTMASDAFDGVKKAAETAWKFFSNNLLPIFEDVVTFVVDNYPDIKNTIDSVFGSVEDAVQPVIDLFNDHLKPAISELLEQAQEDFPDFLTAVEDAFGGAADIINTVTDAIDKAIDAYDRFNKMLPKKLQTDMQDFSPKGLLQNFGLIPQDEMSDFINQYDEDQALKKERNESGKGGGSSNFGDYLPSGRNPQVNYYMNITGNTLMNDRDADILGNKIIKNLKLAGVK